jgi:hypothetical protein
MDVAGALGVVGRFSPPHADAASERTATTARSLLTGIV